MIFMPIIMYRFNKILITKLLYTSIYKDKYFLHLTHCNKVMSQLGAW